MKEKGNIPGNHLSGRLPVHTPDHRLWNGISSGLDQLDVQENYEERLADLPIHQPDESTWPVILMRMRRAGMIKTGTYTLLAVAASIALLISIFRIPEPSTRHTYHAVTSLNSTTPGIRPASGNTPATQVPPSAEKQSTTRNGFHPQTLATAEAGTNDAASPAETNSADGETVTLTGKRLTDIWEIRLMAAKTEITVSWRGFNRPKPSTGNLPYQPLLTSHSVTKYITPDPYDPGKKKGSTFALAANYLPESLENGNGTSLFHNFGLMASLGNEKNRIQSTIGMAYNSEHREYDVNYTQFIPITAPKPGTNSDSTYIMETSRASELEGTERHQYLTYDLGVGRKLFSLGKMTTWVNTGAGFAVKLDNASLRETTIKTINAHNNSQVNTMDLQIPDYNKVNINIMAGLDFNYRILDRLSLSFAPTSRIYLKSVLEKNGASTDSFSLGFRSGMKFDF